MVHSLTEMWDTTNDLEALQLVQLIAYRNGKIQSFSLKVLVAVGAIKNVPIAGSIS